MRPEECSPEGARVWADDLIATITTDPFRARRVIGSYVLAFAALALLAGLILGAGTVGLIWWCS